MKHTCYICRQDKPEAEGGPQSTGNIRFPVWRWICYRCLLDKVCS